MKISCCQYILLFLLVMAISMPLFAAPRQAAPAYSLERIDDCVFLVHNGARQVVKTGEDMSSDSVTLGNGNLLVYPIGYGYESFIRVVDPAKKTCAKLPVKDVLKEWLKDDERWGGHQAANEMRYMSTGGGGINGFFSSVIPQGNSALAVLDWYYVSLSMMPIGPTFLVRITTTPRLSVELVRSLGPGQFDFNRAPPALYRMKHGLLLLQGEELALDPDSRRTGAWAFQWKLSTITTAGKAIKTLAHFPGYYEPAGLLGQRWLIMNNFAKSRVIKQPIWVYELARSKFVPLPGNWAGSDYWFDIPATGNTFWMGRSNGTRRSVYRVRMPGHRRSVYAVPAGHERYLLWQGSIYGWDRSGITIYNHASRRVITLPVP